MSILVDSRSRILVQGITGEYATYQVRAMIDAGSQINAGVTPGRGGGRVDGIPVYDSVAEAMQMHEANASLIYAPPAFALDAVWEALDGGIRTIVVAAEGVPSKDAVLMRTLALRHDAWLIGPNTIGAITPGEALLGSFPTEYASPGRIGIAARSGSLAIEVMRALSNAELGQSTVVAVGGDAVIGRDINDYVHAFERDDDTALIVYLGEVGGLKEHHLADIVASLTKPLVAFIAGVCAPPNERMGHVGAIVYGDRDTAVAKKDALSSAGAHVVETPWQIVHIAARLLHTHPSQKVI